MAVFPCLAGEFSRRRPLQCGVGAALIIILAPGVDFVDGVFKRQEPMGVQTFLSEPSVEAFDLGVVGRRPWSTEVEFDSMFIRPSIHRLRNKFAAIIDLDRRRQAPLQHDAV